ESIGLDEAYHRVAIVALVGDGEALARGKRRVGCLFHHGQCAGREPAPLPRSPQRGLGQPLAIRRIREHEVEWSERSDIAEPGRIAAENPGAALQAERLHVVADQATALRAFLDEDAARGAARQRLETERPGAGKQVEHPAAVELLRVAVDDHVEDRLARTVGSRADRGAARGSEGPSAKFASDDAHLFASPRLRRAPARAGGCARPRRLRTLAPLVGSGRFRRRTLPGLAVLRAADILALAPGTLLARRHVAGLGRFPLGAPRANVGGGRLMTGLAIAWLARNLDDLLAARSVSFRPRARRHPGVGGAAAPPRFRP